MAASSQNSRLRLLATAASLSLAVGCSASREPTAPSSDQAIRLEVLGSVHSRGNSVPLDLVNDSTIAAGTNGCATGLERLEKGAWVRLSTYKIGCYAVYVTVQPGERKRVIAPLPSDLTPGTYRSYHELGMGNLRIAYPRYSDAFEVR